MNLPTQDQVNAAARNIASFAGGLVVMFGLGTKINPDTITSLINATSTLVNDAITLIGIVSTIITAYFAAKSASQKSQVLAVKSMPGVEHIEINEKASVTLAKLAVDPTVDKVAPSLEARDAVTKTATGV